MLYRCSVGDAAKGDGGSAANYAAERQKREPEIMAQKLRSYILPEGYHASPVGSIMALVSDAPDKAVVVKDQGGSVLGVFVAPYEYNALRATRDLANSTDGLEKIRGTYKPSPETVPAEKVFG